MDYRDTFEATRLLTAAGIACEAAFGCLTFQAPDGAKVRAHSLDAVKTALGQAPAPLPTPAEVRDLAHLAAEASASKFPIVAGYGRTSRAEAYRVFEAKTLAIFREKGVAV